jgi:hypothetical protein
MFLEDTYNFYAEFVHLARQICQTAEKQGIQLADANGKRLGAWQADSESVQLNGYGEDSHESFVWERACPQPQEWVKDGAYFDFCKTNRKPYDVVVTALLLAVRESYGDAVRISSDGGFFDWKDGVRLFEEATGLVPTTSLDNVSA